MPAGQFAPSRIHLDYPEWTPPAVGDTGKPWVWNNATQKYEQVSGVTFASGVATLATALMSPDIRPISNSTDSTGFSTANGVRILYVDSVNNRIGIGGLPDTSLHAYSGSAGSVAALASSVATLESNTHAYLSFLVPSGSAAGIIIGQGTNNNYSSLTYNRVVANQWDISTAVAGATSALNIQSTNSSNTNSNAILVVLVGGAGSGDPYVKLVINAVQAWSIGVDNSDSDKFKISTGGVPGNGDVFVVDTTGKIGTSSTVANTNIPSGATARAMPIYNESGTLQGYIPIYASQW